MRSFWLLLLILALGWGLWSLLGSEEEWSPDNLPADLPASDSGSETLPAPPGSGVLLTTGVLTITVRTSDGKIPAGTEAGYQRGGGERVKFTDEKGHVRFSDAPLGDLVIVAHAPGYRDATQRRFLSAGLPTSLVIVLQAEEDPDRR